MLKLGLIGKNISHSLSPEIYNEILDVPFKYDLLDYNSQEEIPPVQELMKNYFGINITTPYKKHFMNSVKVLGNFSVINCIATKENKIQAVNTDYLASMEILNKLNKENKIENVILLGNGSMSEIITRVLKELNFSHTHLYRSTYQGDFTKLDFSTTVKTTLVINACARNYLFSGTLNDKIIFWDLNYKMENSLFISSQCQSYIDGYDLLFRQAIHAARFWGLPLKTK